MNLALWILAGILVLAIGLQFGMRFYVDRRITRAARHIVDTSRRMYEQRHEFRTIGAAEFPRAKREFYDQTQIWLEEQGFRLLGDLEDRTANACMPEIGTFLRLMTSADGCVLALIWQAEFAEFTRVNDEVVGSTRDVRTLEFGTEFSDGTFVSTSPISNAAAIDAPPKVQRFFVPSGTEPESLLRRHSEHVARAAGRKPGVAMVPAQTLEEAITRFHRSQDLMIAHRREVGLLTDDELDNLGRSFNKVYLGLIKQAIRRYERRLARSNSAS